MKPKKCLQCNGDLKPMDKLFCSNECYDTGHNITNRNYRLLKKQEETLLQQRKNEILEAQILSIKKNNLIIRESCGFSSKAVEERIGFNGKKFSTGKAK
jgi:predicted nucleic acid-binding Zn ribbon protein